MTKNEIKEIIKQVMAEETEYQQLFKTMLDRTGKDINSMSDEEKKKFFTAVDKAYKAKSEGRLIDSKKKELNEGWELLGNPVIAHIAVSLIGLLFTYIGGKVYGLITKKEYEEAVKYCIDELVKDDDFIKKAGQIIAKSDKIDKATAEKIVYLPAVKSLTKRYVKTFGITAAGSETLSQSWLEMELRDMIVKAWNTGDVKNSIINKIKKI
jgi:hypothetical protein